MFYARRFGFRFRGASPPWPYTGRGRGGLPRCWYPGAFAASPYSPQINREQEINWLKSEAESIKAELTAVEARLRDLEAGK